MQTVCLIGRPNVGKSTLFNRLIGESKSIIMDTPGITRDRIYGNVEYKGEKISLSKLSENLMVERTGKRWKGYQGPAYFTYNGVLLTDIKANFVTAQQSANEVDDEQD